MEREEMKWQAFMVGENTVLFRDYFSCGQEKQYKYRYIHLFNFKDTYRCCLEMTLTGRIKDLLPLIYSYIH